MAQVSKYPISKVVADRIFEVFIKTLIGIKEKKEADDFIYDLFSPTEKIMLSKRIAIAFLLLKGYQYREISKILRVSLTTIGAVSLSIKHGRGSYERVLTKITRDEDLEEFFSKVVEKLLSTPASLERGRGVWRYLRDEVRKDTERKKKRF